VNVPVVLIKRRSSQVRLAAFLTISRDEIKPSPSQASDRVLEEMPAYAQAHGMERVVDLEVDILHGEIGLAQIGIAIFDAGAERVGEGIFKAAADRPTPLGVALVHVRVGTIVLGRELDTADGKPARRIKERPIPGEAGTQAQRCEPVDLLLELARRQRVAGIGENVGVAIDIGEFAVTLNAENQAVALPEITEMEASSGGLRTIACAAAPGSTGGASTSTSLSPQA
jgi:hypothetical protein